MTFNFTPSLARNAIRILCHHFGYEPNYEQVQVLYIDLVREVHKHRMEGGQHSVESLLLQIMADELHKATNVALADGELEP